jgi:putative hydrolase of the HAD superfamily
MIEAVSLDVGGVLTVPDHGILAHFLAAAGIAFDRAAFGDGHYRAMAEVDRCRSTPEVFVDYHHGFVHAVGVPADQVEVACAVLDRVLVPTVWCQPLPEAREAARRLRAAGIRLAVTSNSNGTVADLLARHEVVQLGPGPGVEVEHISDSGVVGVAKPDPVLFLATAAGLGLRPELICHIGDSCWFDADGAAAAGMAAVHVDPLGLCSSASHDHVGSLGEFADRTLTSGP